jgi:hypothetical protein
VESQERHEAGHAQRDGEGDAAGGQAHTGEKRGDERQVDGHGQVF